MNVTNVATKYHTRKGYDYIAAYYHIKNRYCSLYEILVNRVCFLFVKTHIEKFQIDYFTMQLSFLHKSWCDNGTFLVDDE